jgi:rhodanese-related sulfurtransferase
MRPVLRHVTIFTVFFILVAAQPALAAEVVSVKDSYERAARNEITLVDVRHPNEWRESGIPRGAKPISFRDPEGVAGFVNQVRDAVDGKLDRPVSLIANRSGRSTRAQWALEEFGFTNILNVREGVKGNVIDGWGWLCEKLPMTPYQK